MVSYEHDLDWYRYLGNFVPANVEYKHCSLEIGGDYCKAIRGYDKRFNIVVIDGRDRVNCAINSLSALQDNGMIIWDNS